MDPGWIWIQIGTYPGIQPKMLDPDQMNTDPQPWNIEHVSLSRKSTSGHAMDVWAYLFLCAAAVLWGASDALMKRFSPRELKQSECTEVSSGGFFRQLARDFRSLLLSPAYLACLVANQVRVKPVIREEL